MNYTLILTAKEIEIISRLLGEWPYRVVRPIIDNIAQQVDKQNKDLDSNQS